MSTDLWRQDQADHRRPGSGEDQEDINRARSIITHPLAESRLLMSFFIFHIWMFCSAASGIDILALYALNA